MGDINANNKIDTDLLTHYQKSSAPVNELFPPHYGLARMNNTAEWNEAHFYSECSSKGTCSKATGECQCFPGYEGAACQRTTCPNGCSGHGTCVLIDVEADVHGKEYRSWDAQKTQKCICDGGYTGPDCNQRECSFGVDPVETTYTDTDSVYKIMWKSTTEVGSGQGGVVRFTISFTDDHGEEWTTNSLSLKYESSGRPTYMTETKIVNKNHETYNPTYMAEQVNESIKALPTSVGRDAYVWTVQVNSTSIVHAYPYPDLTNTNFTQAGMEATAGLPNAQDSVSTGNGKSKYVNGQKYRFPLWNTNISTPSAQYNCANDGLCIFVKLSEPKGNRVMKVNYKYVGNVGSSKRAEVAGTDSATSTIVTVTEVGSERRWSEGLDGSPTKTFKSDASIHICPRRGICDYNQGVCQCFEGYSGYKCHKRNMLGML
jgi:hypothetical protein